jgi:[acyl-carrier-protein] S-malonyltransferase
VNGQIITKGGEVRELLVKQAASPVLWEDCIAQIVKYGATTIVEVGPGKVLTGFTKKIAKETTALNIEDVASYEKVLDYFQEVR